MKQKSGFEARILAAFAMAALVVTALTALTWLMARDASQATQRVGLSHQLLNDLLRVRTHTVEVELSTQTFRISGDVARLAERDVAMRAREELMHSLKGRIGGDRVQSAHWAELRRVIDTRLAISRQVETLRRNQGQAAADAFVATAPLAQTRNRTYNLLRDMEEEQQRRLQAQDAYESSARQGMVAAGAAASLSLLALLAGAYVLIRRQLAASEEGNRLVEASITEQNRLLEQRVAERTAQLHDSQTHLRSVIDSVPALIAYVDAAQRYVYVNARYQQRFAPDQADITGHTVREVLGAQRYAIAGPLVVKVLQGQPQGYDWQPFEGVWQAISYVPKFDDHGAVAGYFVLGTDITERKQFELAKREASIVFENSYEGIAVTDPAGNFSKVNPAFTRITGYAEPEVAGRNPRLLASGRHDKPFYAEMWASLNKHDFWQGEIWNRRKDGELYATLQSISVVRDENNSVLHYVSVFADITQLKAHQAELDRVANFDALTSLPNRRLLTDRLQQSLLRARRSGKLSAVCLLDLDAFKSINDTYGHAVGDQVLIGIADHLKSTLRAQDTLARMGGDEFVLLLNDLGTVDDCTHILDRVLQALRQPVQVDGHLLRSTASIGVSLYPADDADPDTLLRHADQAMYLAKQVGKNRYQLFDLDIDRRTQLRRDQLTELRLAMDRSEFVLHYQPKVDLVSGEVTGAEALIRWQHPERGLLAPGAFLHHVSGSELEKPLGEWVLDTALNQIAAWARQGLTIKVSVNISANHLLKPDFCERLALALSLHSAVDPAHLELEMLETAAIEDMEQAVDILHRCTALGVAFSLDDFGTGYSSLTYLRKLPVHTLKIDQSFVRNMLGNAEDLGIVKGVIELANVFHRQVIAEGVETLEHGAVLRRMGCRQVQGYGIARPMPADQLPAWRQAWQQQRIWLELDDEVASLSKL